MLHYASSLRGTRQYWFKQQSWLIAMVDTLGLPTLFFTHSAADLQWPELARLICLDNPDSSSSHSKALQENPATADWFFHHRIHKFIDAFYIGVLGPPSTQALMPAKPHLRMQVVWSQSSVWHMELM